MPDIIQLLQQGSSNLFIFIPSAILLGALHGLEPGHSKTMMAAFIVAIRGTVAQAVILGLAATASHTAVVWIVVLTGLHFFAGKFDSGASEPYFQIVSGILMVAIATWMIFRTWKHKNDFHKAHAHSHHHDETRIIDTGHGLIKLEIYEQGQPPRFRISSESQKALSHYKPADITVLTTRIDGTVQTFQFSQLNGFIESASDIPEPHEFAAKVKLFHGNHSHEYDIDFHEHHHDHSETGSTEYQDAHELAHSNDIRNRFINKNVTTGQIIMFGLTGGLIPCPASITVLLLCLQIKKIALGALLVLCFSIGLALTMVAAGTIAALGVRSIKTRWSGLKTHLIFLGPLLFLLVFM